MINGRVVTDVSGIAALESLTNQRGVTLKGAQAAGRIVARAAKSGAKRVSGALKSAIGMRAAKGTEGETISYAVIGARKKVVKMVTRPGRRKPTKAVPAFYAHLVESGTKPHAVGKGSKVGGKNHKAGAQSGGKHPGTAAQPFLAPALASSRDAAADACLQAMGAEIEKQIAAQSSKIRGR